MTSISNIGMATDLNVNSSTTRTIRMETMLTTMLSVANDLLKLRLFLVVARRYDECHHVGGCEVIGDHTLFRKGTSENGVAAKDVLTDFMKDYVVSGGHPEQVVNKWPWNKKA